MDIEFRRKNSKVWIVEVWEELHEISEPDTLSEERYTEINQWCIDTLGYHARTAYHVFELRKRSHLDWFLIRWK